MFNMRTDLLDSYLSQTAPTVSSWFGHGKLVVVDLSDPFLDGMTVPSSSDTFVQSCFARNKRCYLVRYRFRHLCRVAFNLWT